MQVAHIFPIKNQILYEDETYVMILAHLVKKGLYDPAIFDARSQYIIMDNGLFEKEQVSTDLLDLIKLAEDSYIPVNEIIIPDAVNDLNTTIDLFYKNLQVIEKYQDKYKFMFVAQAATYADLKYAIGFINQFDKLNLSVGISKLSPLDRASRKAIEAYAECKFPIHFLGIKTTFKEILPVSTIIRGCDTSQLAFIDKNRGKFYHNFGELDTISFTRDESVQQPIDLEHDKCDLARLYDLRVKTNQRMKEYGIL